MIKHFSTLLDDISPDKLKLVEKKSEKYYKIGGKIIHSLIREMFKIPSNLLTNDNSTKNEKPFLKTLNRFITNNDILSFSIVRHPFER